MIAHDQFRGRTAAEWPTHHRLLNVEPGNPSTGALRVSNAYPVILPAGRETGLRDYPPSSACGGLRRTGMGRRVLKVVEEYGGGSWSTNSVTKFVYDLPAAPAAQAGGWNLGRWGRCLTFNTLLSTGVRADDEMLRDEGSAKAKVPDRDKGFRIAGTVHDISYGYPVIPPERRETGLRDALGRLAGVESSIAILSAAYEFGALREATVNLGRGRALN